MWTRGLVVVLPVLSPDVVALVLLNDDVVAPEVVATTPDVVATVAEVVVGPTPVVVPPSAVVVAVDVTAELPDVPTVEVATTSGSSLMVRRLTWLKRFTPVGSGA
jgi:hypothetical protein